MSISYRALLRVEKSDPMTDLWSVLEGNEARSTGPSSDGSYRLEFDSTTTDFKCRTVLLFKPSAPHSYVLCERRHPGAISDVEVQPSPPFVAKLLERSGWFQRAVPELGDGLAVLGWLRDGLKDFDQAVLCVGGDGFDVTSLEQQLQGYVAGMAPVFVVGPREGEQLLRAVGSEKTLNPGSIVHLEVHESRTTAFVLPATIVRSRPDSAVRRIAKQVLRAPIPPELERAFRDAEEVLRRSEREDVGHEWLSELENTERERDAARDALAKAKSDLELSWLEQDEIQRDLQHTQQKLRYVERRLRELEDVPVLEMPSEADEFEPNSCEEALKGAQEMLDRVWCEIDLRHAAALDEHSKAPIWSKKIWAALRAFDSYAELRARGTSFRGNFYDFCSDRPPMGMGINVRQVAMKESESTDNNRRTREARMFPVPQTIDPTGLLYMPAHVKVDLQGSVAPRIHFHDDVKRTGRVYVGYVGEHLPTGG